MPYLMLLAFSAIVALVVNSVGPVVANNAAVSKYTNTYAGKTAASAVVIFASIVAASMLMGLVSKKALNAATSKI